MTTETYPSGKVIGYAYDDKGKLVSISIDGTPFIKNIKTNDNGLQSYEYADGSKHTRAYDTNRRVATNDSNAQIVWKWESKPFGESKATGDINFNLRFPGQYYDNETGTHYNINRDYNPVTGRYIQSDPIGFDGGVNGFGYVGGQPINNSDLLGLLQLDNSGKLKFKPKEWQNRGTRNYSGSQLMGYLYTDSGQKVEAYQNFSGHPQLDTDCHGYTFANGKYWINNNQVTKILGGDGYRRVTTPNLQDVVIYRENNSIVHSVRVYRLSQTIYHSFLFWDWTTTEELKVIGLGGEEVFPHINPVTPGQGGGWHDSNAKYSYYRK